MCNKSDKNKTDNFHKSGFYVYNGTVRKIGKKYSTIDYSIKYEPSTWLMCELKKMRD